MDIGIFAKTFNRPTLTETLDAVAAHGLKHVQFNMAVAGLDSLPATIPDALVEQIRAELSARAMTMTAVSGTYNMIHPDESVRVDGHDRLRVLAAACATMGTSVVTLCTGTRDPDDKWRWHPDNDTPAAWRDLLTSIEIALQIADEYDIMLGIEPEVNNVVDSAGKARDLLDEFDSPRLGIIMDGANLFKAGMLPQMDDVLDEAFDLLGGDVIIAHAKDLSHDGDAGHEAAGTGVLNYDLYLMLLEKIGYDGPLILHGLREDQVAFSVDFLRSKLGGAADTV